jgi:hypothetical protein
VEGNHRSETAVEIEGRKTGLRIIIGKLNDDGMESANAYGVVKILKSEINEWTLRAVENPRGL